MTNLLINTYTNDTLFGEPATVYEMTLDTDKKHGVAHMDFVMKSGGRASVSHSRGTQRGMVEITKAFIERYKPASLVNQVHRVEELKAMYTAGLRIPSDLYTTYDTLAKSVKVLERAKSVALYLK